jgi:hypothetical protein
VAAHRRLHGTRRGVPGCALHCAVRADALGPGRRGAGVGVAGGMTADLRLLGAGRGGGGGGGGGVGGRQGANDPPRSCPFLRPPNRRAALLS